MTTYRQFIDHGDGYGTSELHERYTRATPIPSERAAVLVYRKNNRDDRKHLYGREHCDGYDIHDENGNMVASYILA